MPDPLTPTLYSYTLPLHFKISKRLFQLQCLYQSALHVMWASSSSHSHSIYIYMNKNFYLIRTYMLPTFCACFYDTIKLHCSKGKVTIRKKYAPSKLYTRPLNRLHRLSLLFIVYYYWASAAIKTKWKRKSLLYVMIFLIR